MEGQGARPGHRPTPRVRTAQSSLEQECSRCSDLIAPAKQTQDKHKSYAIDTSTAIHHHTTLWGHTITLTPSHATQRRGISLGAAAWGTSASGSWFPSPWRQIQHRARTRPSVLNPSRVPAGQTPHDNRAGMLSALLAILLPCLGAGVLTFGQAHGMIALGQGCPAHLATVPSTPSAGSKASLASIRHTLIRRIPINKDKSSCTIPVNEGRMARRNTATPWQTVQNGTPCPDPPSCSGPARQGITECVP